MASEESLQLAAMSIAFRPDFSLLFSHKGWRGDYSPAAPPAPPAAGRVSSRPPPPPVAAGEKAPSIPPLPFYPRTPPNLPPLENAGSLAGGGVCVFPAPPVPLAGDTRLYAGYSAGEMLGGCCPQENGKRLRFSKTAGQK